MSATEELPAVVATATAALAHEQRRVAALVEDALAHGAWTAPLPAAARSRLVGSGHFPQYAAELDWPPRDVAGHLRDSARIFTDRIRRIRSETDPALADFVTDAPERLADYRSIPPRELADQLRAAQEGLLRAASGVRSAELDRAGIHETDGRVSLEGLLAFLPGHQRDHAEQLTALLGR